MGLDSADFIRSICSTVMKAIFSVMKAVKNERQSAYVIRAGILRFYSQEKLFPRGLRDDMSCVQDWALRLGEALKRLVLRKNWPCFH